MSFESLVLYKKSQTFVNTIYNHLSSLKEPSENSDLKFKFLDIDSINNTNILLNFDCIIVHYSIRICFLQISQEIEKFLQEYKGTKVLFIQDEYDNTNLAKEKIKKIKFDLVFTCVPEKQIENIYPKKQFKSTKFENVLSSYCNEKSLKEFNNLKKSREREIIVGYRGRELPIRYGELGIQKKELALNFKKYCESNNINCDIKYEEKDRLYGNKWIKFLSNCRSSLGSESGSNIFDWDGDLDRKINSLNFNNGKKEELELKRFINSIENKNCMNQVSSRVFESINQRSALILLEGNYSNILIPNRHYIPLKLDYSNIQNIFALLKDNDFIDELTQRAFFEISLSKKYSYQKFQNKVSKLLLEIIKSKEINPKKIILKKSFSGRIKDYPMRPIIFQNSIGFKLLELNRKFITLLFFLIPRENKLIIKRLILSLLNKFNII